MSNKNSSNASAAANQSIVNYQQQQDLMQVAALMFPSLFMAQQSNNQVLNSNQTSSFIQSLHTQQQTLQQQQLASLMQQQALGQLINQQTNHTNGSSSAVVDLSLNKTKPHNNQQNRGKQGQNSSMFSISDLIDTNSSNVNKTIQKDHQTYHKTNKSKQASTKKLNISSTKKSISQAFSSNQNDQLMMFAAAAMQTPEPVASSNLSYDWLLHMSHNNKSQPVEKSQPKIDKLLKENNINETNDNLKSIDIETIEAKIKIPIKHGWRRETIVKEIHKNGIKGDVIYYSPCNKKLRSFQEIERYLSKNETANLTRDNFTFSSKFLVGTFLKLKEPYTQFLNGHGPNESDEHIEEKLRKDLKFNIYNTDEILLKIYELNPKFRLKTPPPSQQPEDNLELTKQENIYQHKQQEQLDLTLKRKEKQLYRDKKTREKWFEYILSREQFSSSKQHLIPCDDTFATLNYSKSFDTIDDMQEKCTKSMPEFTELTDSNCWVGDALQVIEFIGQFAPKLREALTEDDENTGADIESFDNVITDLNIFRQGIENRTEKLRREISQIVQLLLRCLSQTLGKTNDPDLPTSDDSFLINKLTKIECNEQTYSEILRLYIKWSFVILTERRKLTNGKFNIDVTADLHKRLEGFLTALKENNFDFVQPEIKVSIMAYLCDELISTSPLLDLYGVQNNQEMVYQDDNTVSCVVEDLDETIDEFHSLRQETCQLDSKKRQLRSEKLTALGLINLATTVQSDKDKQQKLIVKLDKSIAQLDKKRLAFKNSSEKCSNKLRSGKNLGQDRYMRHYWSLSTTGGIFIEAACKTKPGEMFYNNDNELLNDPYSEIKDIVNDMIDKVEEVKLSEEELTIANMSHLINRLEWNNPFRIAFNSSHSDALKLSFRQIEYLIRDQIESKQPRPIDEKFLNKPSLVTSSKWWLCDSELLFKQLTDCLSKRGYREKALAKSLHKLNEDNSVISELTAVESDQTVDSASLTSDDHIFNKLKSFCKDFAQKNEAPIKEKVRNVAIYREQMKGLKYVYSLEDRVFTANLQQPASKEKNSQTDRKNLKDETEDESESPIDIAVERLGELEQRIERRYLKFPFVPKKKIVKLNLDDDEKDDNEEQVPVDVVVTEELCRWRNLVKECKTTSQLVILVDELSSSIAWDKSIMKVICQICNSDSNEDKLLLCDNCDKGNHTYCFKPKLDNIPDGDWYCFVCIGILSGGDKLCCVCGSSDSNCPYESSNSLKSNTTDIHKCNKCSKFFHGQCLPNAKYFKTTHKWNCLNCSNTKCTTTKVLKTNLHVNNATKITETNEIRPTKRNNNNDRSKGAKKVKSDESEATTPKNKQTKSQKRKANENDVNKTEDSISDSKFNSEQENNNSIEKKQVKNKKGKRAKNSLNISIPATTPLSTAPVTPPGHVVKEKDLAMCKMILNEMGKNDSAWPFLEKVDEKGYPDYYEVIKEPIDIESIKTKLKNRAYKTKEQFAYDCRLIFDNCEFFNEDESQIGQAGHKLRAYFETKWLKIFD